LIGLHERRLKKALCKSRLKNIQFVVFILFSFYASNAFLSSFFL